MVKSGEGTMKRGNVSVGKCEKGEEGAGQGLKIWWSHLESVKSENEAQT